MGVTLQFFAMIMPFGCALMGFATAVSAQTSWYLVVPLLFVGFEMDIFEAVVLSVLLDLCNGATLSVFNGYHGDVDWRFGTLFGLLTAACAVPPALLLRTVIAHEQEFVKFTAAFIPAVMSISFFVKGAKLLKQEKRERQERRAAEGIGGDVADTDPSSSVQLRMTAISDLVNDNETDGFVQAPDEDVEGEEEAQYGDDGDEGAGDEETAALHSPSKHARRAHEDDDDDGENDGTSFLSSNASLGDHAMAVAGGSPSHLKARSDGFIQLDEEDEGDGLQNDQDPGLGSPKKGRVGKRAVRAGLTIDTGRRWRSDSGEGGAKRGPFVSATNLLAKRPTLRIKKFSIPYKGIVSMTVIGHIFLGIFMGILYVGGGIFFAFMTATFWGGSLKTSICTGIYSMTIVLVAVSLTFANMPDLFTREMAQHLGLSVPFGVVGALVGASLASRISKGWLQILIAITSIVVAGAVLTNAFNS